MTEQLTKILRDDSGVDGQYRHAPKWVTAGETLELAGTILKWYAVHPVPHPVSDEVTRLARSYLGKTAIEAAGMGFVILHRCGKDSNFYFLIVNTWRNNNELWESVFYKNGDAMTDFAPFPRDASHKPTYCVWEMVPVFHEQKVWERFLNSSRNDAAARAWLDDRYAGEA